jgi:hypothetical protein
VQEILAVNSTLDNEPVDSGRQAPELQIFQSLAFLWIHLAGTVEAETRYPTGKFDQTAPSSRTRKNHGSASSLVCPCLRNGTVCLVDRANF